MEGQRDEGRREEREGQTEKMENGWDKKEMEVEQNRF